jgi:RimJ/RimL family protein N-acetyltransferase
VLTHRLADGIVLGPLEPWQAEEFAAAVERARDHLRPWIPFATRVVDAATARELLQRFADKRAEDTGAMFGIWADGVLVGGTLFPSFNPAMGVAEIGVWLDPSVEGRGLIQAACRLMIDYVFRARGMHRVEWRCDPRNERSRAAATRLGLTYEGTLRSNFVVDGHRTDSEVWAVLASEWPTAAPTEPGVRNGG